MFVLFVKRRANKNSSEICDDDQHADEKLTACWLALMHMQKNPKNESSKLHVWNSWIHRGEMRPETHTEEEEQQEQQEEEDEIPAVAAVNHGSLYRKSAFDSHLRW